MTRHPTLSRRRAPALAGVAALPLRPARLAAVPPSRAARMAVAVAALVLACLCGAGARADGYYAAFDYSPTQPMGVLSVDRGRFTYAAAIGRGTDGRVWAKAAALRLWTRGQVRLKFGTSLYAVEPEDWRQRQAEAQGMRLPPDTRAGIRVGADSYVDRGPWASYWMVEHDTTQHASLALVSGQWKSTGLGAELSLWKQEDDPLAPTLLTRWTPAGRDVSLRLGWRFKDDEAFLGVSISRFK